MPLHFQREEAANDHAATQCERTLDEREAVIPVEHLRGG